MSERLARQIREALGEFNDDAEPVVSLVRDVCAALRELQEDDDGLTIRSIDEIEAEIHAALEGDLP